MIVTVGHLGVLKRLEEKAQEGVGLHRLLDEISEEDLERLIQLQMAGLVHREEEEFVLTRSGRLILETFFQLEEDGLLDLSDKTNSYRLISSRIISMLVVAERAQGRTDFSKVINQALEERGLAQEGRLHPLALSLLEAYRGATVSLIITPSLAETLKKIPPGPGEKSLLVDLPDEHILELEAQRLLTFSLPEGRCYSLTGVGNQLRAALKSGLAPEVTIHRGTLEDIVSGQATEPLKRLGALDEEGNLTYAGKHLLNAAQLFFKPIVVNPSLDLDQIDLDLLEQLQLKKDIREEELILTMEEAGIRDEGRLRQGLFRLEGFGLVRTTSQRTLELTELGKELIREPEIKKAPVDAREVMALTTVRMENLSPDEGWVELATHHGSLGRGFPSKRGQLLARLASRIERLPVITAEELKILRDLPLWRGISREEILTKFDTPAEEVERCLRRLIASGVVDVWPGSLYALSPAGEKIKQGLSGVPEGVAFPLTPHIWRLLLALRAVGKSRQGGRKIRVTEEKVQEAIEIAAMGPEAFARALEAARICRYIPGYDILETGVLLLEGAELLKQLITHWEEILVF